MPHCACSPECAGNKRHVAHGSTETPRSPSEITALGIIAIEGHFEFEDVRGEFIKCAAISNMRHMGRYDPLCWKLKLYIVCMVVI